MQLTSPRLHKYALKGLLRVALHDRFIVHGEDVGRGIVCISFDCDRDADMERIPSLIRELKEADIVTSFALFGRMVEKYRGIVGDVLKNGHEVVNHSYSHPTHFALIGPDRMKQEIESFQRLMREGYDYAPVGFRAPHLLRKYNSDFFRALKENHLYDTSYIGSGVALVDGVIEVPLSACPEHPLVCFDYWHHFQLPLRANPGEFFRVWETLLAKAGLTIIYLDPSLTPADFLREMIRRVPGDRKFCRLADVATLIA